jgi:hypothetical protein
MLVDLKKPVPEPPRPKSIDRYSEVYEDEEKMPDSHFQEISPP